MESLLLTSSGSQSLLSPRLHTSTKTSSMAFFEATALAIWGVAQVVLNGQSHIMIQGKLCRVLQGLLNLDTEISASAQRSGIWWCHFFFFFFKQQIQETLNFLKVLFKQTSQMEQLKHWPLHVIWTHPKCCTHYTASRLVFSCMVEATLKPTCYDIIKNFVGFSMKWGRNSKPSLSKHLCATFTSLLTIWTLRQTELTGRHHGHLIPQLWWIWNITVFFTCPSSIMHSGSPQFLRVAYQIFICLSFMHSIVRQTHFSVDCFSIPKPALHTFQLWFWSNPWWVMKWFLISSILIKTLKGSTYHFILNLPMTDLSIKELSNSGGFPFTRIFSTAKDTYWPSLSIHYC